MKSDRVTPQPDKSSQPEAASPPEACTKQSGASPILGMDALFRVVTDRATDAMCIFDEKGTIVYANGACASIFGTPRSDLVGVNIGAILSPDQAAQRLRYLTHVVSTGETVRSEARLNFPTGTRWLAGEYSPLPIAPDGSHLVLLVARDITEQKRAESDMRDSAEERDLLYRAGEQLGRTLDLSTIFTIMRSLIAERMDCDVLYLSNFAPSTRLITCLFAWQDGQPMDISAFPPVPLAPEGKGTQSIAIRTGKSIHLADYNAQRQTSRKSYYVDEKGQVTDQDPPPEDPNIPRSALIVPLKLGQEVRGVIQIFSYRLNAYSDQDLRILEAIGTQVVAAVNNALLYEKVKQELQARKESEERFRQLAEHIQEVFWLYDLQDERMTYLSPAFESIYGMAVDEVYENANAWQKVIQPDDIGEVVKAVQRQREGHRTVCEYRVLTPDGGVRWVLDQAFPICNEHGELVRVAGIAANITERKQAEDALRRREAEFKALVENSPDYVARVDTRGRYLYVNPTIVKSTGLSLAEILGKTGKEVNLPDGYVDLDAVVHSGDTQTSIVQITGADDQARYMQVRMVPEPDSSGTVRSVLAITRDLTDLVEAQAELAQLNQTLEQRVAERTALLAEAQRIAHLGSVDIDIERKEAILSEEAWRILRREPTGAPIPLDELISHIHPDDLIDVRNALANAPPNATSFELELRVVRANGLIAHINARAEAISRDDRLVRLLCTALDVTERRKAEEEQRRLTAILEATTDLVANWNLEQKITFINLGGRQMLGLGLESTRTDLCLSNIHPEWALQKLQEEGIPFASEQHVWAGESAVLHQEGQEIPVSQVVIAHRDRHGNVEYFSTIMRDMTLQKQAEEALRRSRDDLSAANLVLENAARLKDEFLASMSHELRTPLTSILGLSEALRQQVYGPLNDRQLKSLATIETSGQHLLDLINDILDLSKIEAGQFELHMNLCTVDEICMSALQMIKGMANKKRQTVGFTISPAGMEMEADSRRLKQMLVNLLSNAVKFTPEEGQLGLEVQGDFLEGVVRFQVWDRGIGIAAEDFPRLFEPFTQLDAKLSRQYSGSGLGLSLVRRMAELHGGSVSVESRLGEGSVFTIALPWRSGAVRRRLPQGAGHTLPSDATRHLDERGKNEPPLILLADDNPTNVEMYVEFLSSNGYRLATAEDGLEAVELTAKLRPSLVLMDIQMPGMDGLEAIRRIRSSREPGIAHVPIIALTALAMPGDRERCLNAGANDYLSKPISLASMVNMVEAYLTRSGTQ